MASHINNKMKKLKKNWKQFLHYFIPNIYLQKKILNKKYISKLKEKIICGKINLLWFDWPFGKYIFEEMEKEKYSNINLIKFSIFDLFNLKDKVEAKKFFQKNSHLAKCAIRRMLKDIKIQGLLVTHDWYLIHRETILAFQKANIPVINILHEGVFQDEDIYYEHTIPISDLTLVWGEIHKRIFTQRGYDKEKIKIVGSIKLNSYKNFKPSLSREVFFNSLNLSDEKRTILYCCQLCDNQWNDQGKALKAQLEIISDLASIAQENNYNLIVRNAPSTPNKILPEEFKNMFKKQENIVFDGEDPLNKNVSSYKVSPGDSIYYADIIVGLNTTMQLEASLINRPALVAQYFDFKPKWCDELGLPICKNREQLQNEIMKNIENKKNLITENKKKSFYENYGYNPDIMYDPLKNIEKLIIKFFNKK